MLIIYKQKLNMTRSNILGYLVMQQVLETHNSILEILNSGNTFWKYCIFFVGLK